MDSTKIEKHNEFINIMSEIKDKIINDLILIIVEYLKEFEGKFLGNLRNKETNTEIKIKEVCLIACNEQSIFVYGAYNGIQEYDYNGNRISKFDGVSLPMQLQCMKIYNSKLFIAGWEIFVFDLKRKKCVRRFECEDECFSIDFHGKYIYASMCCCDEIHVYTLKGKLVHKFGSEFNNSPFLNKPTSIAIEGDFLYVNGYGSKFCKYRIVSFSKNPSTPFLDKIEIFWKDNIGLDEHDVESIGGFGLNEMWISNNNIYNLYNKNFVCFNEKGKYLKHFKIDIDDSPHCFFDQTLYILDSVGQIAIFR